MLYNSIKFLKLIINHKRLNFFKVKLLPENNNSIINQKCLYRKPHHTIPLQLIVPLPSIF